MNLDHADDLSKSYDEGYRDGLAADRWQPIEDAPKDGTGFIYFQPVRGGRKLIGCAVWHDGAFRHVDWRDGDENQWFVVDPTHFMPLPQPPEADT